MKKHVRAEAKVVGPALLTFMRLLRREHLVGNVKPKDKPRWPIDLSFISENQKNESLGERGSGVGYVSQEKRTEHRLEPKP